MNSYKTLLPVSVGMLAFGAFLGYIVSKKILEEKYEKVAQDEIDSVKLYYHRLKGEATPGRSPVPKTRFLETSEVEATDAKLYETSEVEATDAKLYETDEEEEQSKMDYELSLAEQQKMNEELSGRYKYPKSPYPIDYAEWAKPSDVLDKVDLYYYKGDDILCDSKDSIISDPEELLGPGWTKLLKDRTTIFIRDERLLIDYEIYSISALYSDEITSKIETDKERKYRRTARAKKAMDDAASEHIDDKDESGEYVVKRPEKSKNPVTPRRSKYVDYTRVRNIEEAEELEELEDSE